MNFSARSCKKCLISWKSTRNHRFGQNYATFWTNFHVFEFRSTFEEKVGKGVHFVKKHEKSSICPKLATFRKNYHVFAFRWTFQEKVAKSASFREKAPKIIDLAKTLQLFEQTIMFLHFDELLRKSLEKVPHFVKKHEKTSIWPKLATFRTNYHVFAFRWTI